MITLVHFAFVFPEPKTFLKRGPWVPYLLCGILYGYYGITVILYSLGVTAFGTTFPLFCFLTLVLVSVLSHSLIRQEDGFLKKQIEHSLVAPVLVSLFLLAFQLLPVMLGIPPMSYASFALFSLILPYSLPSALENIHLYQERLAIEQASQREKEGIRRDFHDRISGGFHHIDALAGKALEQRDPDPESLEKQLEAIKRIAIDCSREVTDFLQSINDSLSTSEDFCAFLRQKGYDWLDPLGIGFELKMSPSLRELPRASPRLRICLYHIFQEAVTNVIRHAHATMVRVSVHCHREWLICEISDNGIGFDPAGVGQGHSGLRNMRNRVEELGGLFALQAMPGGETCITVQLPFHGEKNTSFAVWT